MLKAVITRFRNPGIKPGAVNIPMTRTAAHAIVTGSYAKNPFVSQRHSGLPSTRNERMTLCNPAKLTTANEPFPRPKASGVPRGRVPQSSVGTILASKGRQEVTVKPVIPRSRNPGIKSAVNIPMTRTRAHTTSSVSERVPST